METVTQPAGDLDGELMSYLACCFWWLVTGLLLGTGLSWLLHALVRPSAEKPVVTPPTPTPPPPPPRPPLPPSPQKREDQIEAIEGIGVKTAEVLRRRGLRSFADVANATPERLSAILDEEGSRFESARPDTWPGQARLLDDGDILGFLELIGSLHGGIPRSRA